MQIQTYIIIGVIFSILVFRKSSLNDHPLWAFTAAVIVTIATWPVIVLYALYFAFKSVLNKNVDKR